MSILSSIFHRSFIIVSSSVCCASLIVGCASSQQPASRVEVEDRVAPAPVKRVVVAPQPVSTTAVTGAPVQHIVAKGDTLFSISRQYQVDWRSIQSANGLTNPDQIAVGQRLIIPGSTTVTSGVVPAPQPTSTATQSPTVVKQSDDSSVQSAQSKTDTLPSQAGIWQWPVDGGQVVLKFGENGNKGLDIAAKEGTPVLAAAAGKVIFSSNNIRGYGNLIVIKHTNNYLTAYGYNKQLLVKEGQSVKKGDKIAEVGSSGTDAAKLHFEIRDPKSKPVDPLKYLPKR